MYRCGVEDVCCEKLTREVGGVEDVYHSMLILLYHMIYMWCDKKKHDIIFGKIKNKNCVSVYWVLCIVLSVVCCKLSWTGKFAKEETRSMIRDILSRERDLVICMIILDEICEKNCEREYKKYAYMTQFIKS